MITLRKRLAGPRARHMLFPAFLFLLVAVTSAAASETARRLCEPAMHPDAVATAVELSEREGI